MKARGTLARLEALEMAERARGAAVEAAKEQQWQQALFLLSAADREALYACLDAEEAGGAWWAEVMAAGEAVQGVPLPGGEDAWTWGLALETVPAGVAFLMAPAGTAAYFEREAARCDVVKEEASRPGAEWRGGVGVAALTACASWTAGHWRWLAALAGVIGEAAEG